MRPRSGTEMSSSTQEALGDPAEGWQHPRQVCLQPSSPGPMWPPPLTTSMPRGHSTRLSGCPAVRLQPPHLPNTTKHTGVRAGSCGPSTLPPPSAPSPNPLPCRPEGSTPKQELSRGPSSRHPAGPQDGQGCDRHPWTVQRGVWTASPAPRAPASRASCFLRLPAPPDLRAEVGARPCSSLHSSVRLLKEASAPSCISPGYHALCVKACLQPVMSPRLQAAGSTQQWLCFLRSPPRSQDLARYPAHSSCLINPA